MAEHDWQRSTDYPSPSALLEAYLDGGMRFASHVEIGWESARQVALGPVKEPKAAEAEISRCFNRVGDRHIRTAHLQLRADQFGIALGEIRRLAGTQGEGQ